MFLQLWNHVSFIKRKHFIYLNFPWKSLFVQKIEKTVLLSWLQRLPATVARWQDSWPTPSHHTSVARLARTPWLPLCHRIYTARDVGAYLIESFILWVRLRGQTCQVALPRTPRVRWPWVGTSGQPCPPQPPLPWGGQSLLKACGPPATRLPGLPPASLGARGFKWLHSALPLRLSQGSGRACTTICSLP